MCKCIVRKLNQSNLDLSASAMDFKASKLSGNTKGYLEHLDKMQVAKHRYLMSWAENQFTSDILHAAPFAIQVFLFSYVNPGFLLTLSLHITHMKCIGII